VPKPAVLGVLAAQAKSTRQAHPRLSLRARLSCGYIETAGALWQIGLVAGIFAALLGLVIGSFLNVCILRIPAGESVSKPRSRCPHCQHGIAWYDNLPVLSWLLLGGKCRHCKTRISPMYPAIELLSGALFFAAYSVFGLGITAVKWATLSALLLVLAATDIRVRLLPNVVNLSGAIAGLLLSCFTAPVDGTALWLATKLFDFPPPRPALSLGDALLGGATGAGILWLVGEGYFRLRGREGMGLGDVKMMGMVGIFLGLKRTLLTVLVGSVLGSVVGIGIVLAARKGRDYELPFGAFLATGALLVIYFGSPVISWYQSLLR
jgi:leader peptidase (prepilin peptidase) / N-methyltransferase